jgi:hypothetical protein
LRFIPLNTEIDVSKILEAIGNYTNPLSVVALSLLVLTAVIYIIYRSPSSGENEQSYRLKKHIIQLVFFLSLTVIILSFFIPIPPTEEKSVPSGREGSKTSKLFSGHITINNKKPNKEIEIIPVKSAQPFKTKLDGSFLFTLQSKTDSIEVNISCENEGIDTMLVLVSEEFKKIRLISQKELKPRVILSGVVMDFNDNLLSRIKVRIPHLSKEDITDTNGEYELTTVEPSIPQQVLVIITSETGSVLKREHVFTGNNNRTFQIEL